MPCLYGAATGSSQKLQHVQNIAATARIVLQVARPSHAQPLLKQFQWLPIRQQSSIQAGCFDIINPQHLNTDQVNSTLHPSGDSSTSFGWGKGGKVTAVGSQVTLCDPIWYVISCSCEMTSTNCYIRLLTFLYRSTSTVTSNLQIIPAPFVLLPSIIVQTDYQNLVCRPHFYMHCTFHLELFRQLHCRQLFTKFHASSDNYSLLEGLWSRSRRLDHETFSRFINISFQSHLDYVFGSVLMLYSKIQQISSTPLEHRDHQSWRIFEAQLVVKFCFLVDGLDFRRSVGHKCAE